MTDNKAKQINRKVEIPIVRLWIIWLLLFVFPSLISILAFEKFSKEYAYFAKTDLISNCFDSLKKYKDSTIPENFIEEQIALTKELDTKKTKEELKKDIDDIFCGESLFCLFFDKDCKNISCVKTTKNIDNNLLNISTYFYKKYINNIIKSELATNDTVKNLDVIKNKEQFGVFLQRIFKTTTNVTVNLNKVARNFSVKYDGELYFVLGNFNEKANDCYGFFAVIRGKDFSFHKMLEKKHKDYPYIRIIFKEIDLNESYTNSDKFYSGINKDENGLKIISPTSQKLARHILHGGSANLIKQYGKLFPFIEYHIPIEQYQTSLKKEYDLIKKIALILLLISGVYFLRISLFGFREDFSFKNKMIALILITALFPFGILSLSIFTIYKYNRFISRINIQQHTETELQIISQELDEYLNELEINNSKVGLKISDLLSDEKYSEFLDYFHTIGEKIPLSSYYIYFDTVPKYLKKHIDNHRIYISYPERTSNKEVDLKNDYFLSEFIPDRVLYFSNQPTPEVPERKREDKIKMGKDDVTFEIFNDVFTLNGRFFHYVNSAIVTWLTMQPIVHKKNQNFNIAVFASLYEPQPILNSFYPKCTMAKKGFKENIGDYEINYSFIPVEKSGKTKTWMGSGIIETDDKNYCLENELSETIVSKDNKKIFIKKKNQNIPHLAIATIKEKGNSSELFFASTLLTSIVSYLFLILFFANKLIDLMVVEPVLILANSAKKIARGSDNWDIEIKTGDEFEDLNNSFKQLVVGLKERNILKSYVSEDAYSDIQENENKNLLPGGEYIEATIVFSAIKDYEKTSKAIGPQESIKLLSKYMSLAEEVAKENSGSIDKIIGDTIMLVFRDNPQKESHGLRAAKAALEFVEKSKASGGLNGLYTGIASGRVISGKIGSYTGKLDFTVIGNPVNLAARFKSESKNGTEQTGIIISGTTIGLMNGKANVKFLRRVSIKGKARKYNIYELLGIRE